MSWLSHWSTMSEETCIRDEPWNVVCKIVSQKGSCAAGHRVDDKILFTGNDVQGKICIHALYSIIPKVYAMMYNARFPWLKDQCKATHACPDAFNPVLFEVTRVQTS